MYPVEYTKIKNETHATRLVIITDNGSASIPAFKASVEIQDTWLCISLPASAIGIKV